MSDKLSTIENLDNQVLSVIGNPTLEGFEKAYTIARATGEIQKLLTEQYMAPIMNLQGNRLGFRTDKDRDGGYPVQVVKNCLIEAVLMGVQPVGNQFNIIAGNSYITKEGFGYLLSKMEGLWYEIIPELPRINPSTGSAAVVMRVSWAINGGTKKERPIEIPVKVNKMMGTDAVIGKATRKTRAWLYNTLTGCEVSDGDITDPDFPVRQTINVDDHAEAEANKRTLEWIAKAKNIEDLEILETSHPDMSQDCVAILEAKKEELKNRG